MRRWFSRKTRDRRLAGRGSSKLSCWSSFEPLEVRVVLSAAEASVASAVQVYAESGPGASAIAAPQAEVIVDQASPIVLATPGQTYQLQTSLRFSGNGIYIAAPNVTLDLNGHSIYYGGGNTNTANDHLQGAHGVVVYIGWHNTEISIPGATNPDNATIKNGRIIHEGAGAVSHAIYGRQGLGTTIQDVYAEASGKDTHSVFFYSGNVFLYRNTLISHSAETFDRHAGPANVRGTTVVAHNNVLIGGNSGFAVLENSEIIGNVISHDGHVTNGYGVWLYRTENVVVRDNIILPSNGRGVLLNAGSNIEVSDNVILHLEAPNAEFGDSLNAPAIRSRYETSGSVITGNTGLGIAGADRGLTSASGLYLSDDGSGVPSRYEDNDLTTILVGARDVGHYAQPITFEHHGYVQQSSNAISGNVFRSNDSLVRVQGWDGSLEAAAPVTGNLLEWVDGSTAAGNFLASIVAKLDDIQMSHNPIALQVVNDAVSRIQSLILGVPLNPSRATWFIKDGWGPAKVDGTFLDNHAGSGVALDSFAYESLSAGEVSVKIGQTVPIVLHGASGPLASSAVQITTDRSDSYDETTNASGSMDVPVIEFAFEKAYAANSSIVKQNRATTTITVAGYQPLTLANSLLLSHKHDATPFVIQLTPIGSSTPQAGGDSFTATEDTALVVPAAGVLQNDSDPLARALSAVLVTGAAHGVVLLNSNGSFTYTPNANYRGADSFSYRAVAGSDQSSIATVSIQVNPVNDAPAGTNRTITQSEDTPYSFSVADFGFTDPLDSPANAFAAVRISSLPSAGQLLLNGAAVTAGQFVSAADIAAGRLRFTPASNANGTNYASFTFQVQDDGGTASGGVNLDPTPNTMTLNVTPVNDAPSGNNFTASTPEDTSYTFTAANFGFMDPQDSPANNFAAVRITTLPVAGQLLLNGAAVTAGQFVSAADIAAGRLRFTPASNATGTNYASFTFQVQDDGGTASGGSDLDPTPNTITVNVTPVNDAPAGGNFTASTPEDTSYTFTAANFGFTDPQDSPANNFAAVRITTLPVAGQLMLSGVAVTAGQSISAAQLASSSLRFIPAANAHGSNYASFTFQVQDDGGTASGGSDLDPTPNTMTLNVTPVNDAPSGSNFTASTPEDTSYTFTAANFGFTDPQDSPANNFAAVRITTLPVAGQLLLSGVAVTAGQSISAAQLSASSLRFVPAANAHGSNYASFTFQVQDDGGTASGGVNLDPTPNTMTLNVTGVNDPPSGASKSVTMTEDTTYVFSVADFGFSDPQDSPANGFSAVRIATLPVAGQLLLNGAAVTAGQSVSAAQLAAGSLRFTPAPHAHDANYASFTFQVQDDGGTASGGSDLDPTPNTISVTVMSVNDFPLGLDRVVSTQQNSPYTFLLTDFGFHDPADTPPNNFVAVRVTTLPGAGTLTNNGSPVTAGQFVSAADILAGRLQFVPAAGSSGSGYASFTFQVQDDGGTASGGMNLDLVPNTITMDLAVGVVGLSGVWQFDEGTGQTAYDASGNGSHAALQGASFAAGQFGGSLQMTQASKWARVPNSPSLNPGGAVTLAAWIAPLASGTQTFLAKSRMNEVDGFELSLSNSGKVFARFNQSTLGDAFRIESRSSYPTDGTWMHVAVTYDGGQIRLYINGALQAIKVASFTIAANGLDLGIGADSVGDRGMRGRIDDALVANRAFNSAEIASLYAGSLLSGGVPNTAPIVNAGPDLATPSGVAVNLHGSVSDDGLPQPGAISSQWSVINGPGSVTFGNANSPTSSATFSTTGAYVLRLTATDGSLIGSDEVTIQVSPAGTASLLGFWNFLPSLGGGYPSAIGHLGSTQDGATVSGDGRLTLTSAGQNYLVADMPALQITEAITLAAWIKPASGGAQSIVKKAAGNSSDGFELGLSDAGKVFVRFNEQSAANSLRVDSATSYPTTGSNWMHVAATYDGSTIRLYINGQLQASKAASFAIGTSGQPLLFGSGLIGQMDEVLLDNHALSAAEIDQLYRGQLQPAALTNLAPTVQVGADLSAQVGIPITLSGSAVDDGQPGSPLTYQWVAVSGPGSVNFGNANSALTSANFTASGTYLLRLWASDGQFPVSDDLQVTVGPARPNSDLVGIWRFDGAGPTVADSSGNQNHGTLRSGATLGVGHSGGGVLMSQAGQSVLVPHSPALMPTQQITVAAWIAPIVKGTQTVISKATMNAVDGYEVSLSSSGKVFVRFNQDSAGDSLRVDSTTNYSTNGGWLHVVATYDGAVIRLFINGQLEASKGASFSIASNTLGVGIGAEASGARGMRGRIDDVLIANRALRATEVVALFSGVNPGAAFAGSMVLLAAPEPVAEPFVSTVAVVLPETNELSAASAEDTPVDWTTLVDLTTFVDRTVTASPQLLVDGVIDDFDLAELFASEHAESDPLISDLVTARLLR